MTENLPPDPGGSAGPAGPAGSGRRADPGEAGEGQEADVLGSYLEFSRIRLGAERFETLVRAVQTTCALLAEGHQVLLGEPAEDGLTGGLRGDYLSLMAVMITGHLDHHLVELETSYGGKGWAVVENVRTRPGHPRASPAARDAAGRAWSDGRLDGRLDGIVRTTGSTAP
ncbi:hypothetical protein OTB20_22140 [Streptomyces sp. H27-H1]|uniref:hypothetical protein n=1 Tax=Streptomyces sp. H27-H1 TaxID=2996461 RepID=UPI00226E065F|nr:hypothetical protein [Streptomyces sp. H27-H1]MCY0928860.1 hypothetical protein [Streptomyces sp. H27-H1]